MIPIEDLLEAGVHFGHRVNKWNPKMAPYIFGERNGVHIIDLIQTLGYLEESYLFLSKYTGRSPAGLRGPSAGTPLNQKSFENGIGSKVLFVGTKKQVASIIQKEAENSQSNYVNHRWLGGLLTNWSTIKLCIAKLKHLQATGLFETGEMSESTLNNSFVATKKEKALLKKQYEKLKKFFGGIETMGEIPEIVIIVGQDCEINAVKECQKLAASGGWRSENSSGGRPSPTAEPQKTNKNNPLPRTITILDTNCDPSLADLFIPANDDSTKSVELLLTKLGEAIRLPR